MKITIDGRMLLPQMSGVGRYLLGLCRGFQALEENSDIEYQLLIQSALSTAHPVYGLSGKHLTLKTLPVTHMNIAAQAFVPLELLRNQPDLFHYPHFDLPFASPGKIIATIHDLKYLTHPEYFPHYGHVKKLVIHLMTKYTCHRAKYIICVSGATANRLSKFTGIPAIKMKVIYHGIDPQFFNRISEPRLNSYRTSKGLNNPFLLFVGERRPHKNLPGLIHSFHIFRQMVNIPYELVVAGRRYADYQLPEKTVSKFGLEDSVHFLDYVPETDLPLLYQSAEAFVMISNYEGFGLPAIEAMACGTPVIASNTTALPEIVGAAGLLVPPDQPEMAAEAILKVIKSGSSREQIIAAGLKHAQTFTWNNCARQTRSVYQDALSS